MNRPLQILLPVLLVGLILATAGLLVVTLQVMLFAVAGVLFGIFLNGLSRWTSHHTPLSYRWSYAVVAGSLPVLLGLGLWVLGSQIAEHAVALWTELQGAVQQFHERISQNDLLQRYLENGEKLQESLLANSKTAMGAGLQWVGWAFTGIFIILFVGLYAAFDPELYVTGLVKLVPQDQRDRAREIMQKLHVAMENWMVGRLISMSIIGAFTSLGLWLLNVPLPLTLGVLAALLTFVPNLGPVLAAVPQTLLALRLGTSTVVYVVLLNVALQGVESYLITPIVQRQQVMLPPALTIFVQLLMGILVGVIGVMMAAPLTVAVMLLVQTLYIRDYLGDPEPGRLADGNF